MGYIENPKTKGSGVVCAIPQGGRCPVNCVECFFQSGRSYLEPLENNLPNMPDWEDTLGRVVRFNDGNDSNNDRKLVISKSRDYRHVFFNTAIPKELEKFPGPVVLTVNPAEKTDDEAYYLDIIPSNLMFVRFRANMWNRSLLDDVVYYYTANEIPVIITFMAYYNESISKKWERFYNYRKRTLNSYWAITQSGWDIIVSPHVRNKYVYTCGKNADTFACHRCGNCLREYFATMERLING